VRALSDDAHDALVAAADRLYDERADHVARVRAALHIERLAAAARRALDEQAREVFKRALPPRPRGADA
jgi:hypothetical protein